MSTHRVAIVLTSFEGQRTVSTEPGVNESYDGWSWREQGGQVTVYAPDGTQYAFQQTSTRPGPGGEELVGTITLNGW